MLLKHDGEYATFKQWQDLSGKVRKGERSEIIIFWKVLTIEKEQKYGEQGNKADTTT